MAISEAAKLYGTDRPGAPSKTFTAGPLSIVLEGSAIRYVRYQGHEAIRGIDYLVRDDSWRTPPAVLKQVSEHSDADGFKVELDGEVRQDDIHYRFRLAIEGSSDGNLNVTADAEALSTFMTNRTGFVVLHPIIGVAGAPVTVTAKDGSTRETVFPSLISPGQPIFDIRALRHEVSPGLFVTCRMEAALPYDAEAIYEMEDQRNWTDASYKTYVGSLLDPWPFQIAKGERIKQSVLLTFDGEPSAAAAGAGDGVAVHLGDEITGRMPAMGMGIMAKHRAVLGNAGHPAHQLQPQFVTAYVERDDDAFEDVIGDYAGLTKSYACDVQLELVLPVGKSPKPEIDAAAAACSKAGLEPARVIALPKPYLRSIQPTGPWPEVVDLAHIYNKVREAFPKAAVLSGMLTDFTELNRKRPPPAPTDGMTCTTTPLVHAPDDTSVMETLETLPAVVASMESIAGGKPLHLGPSSMALRHNPNGAATAPNPERERIAMADEDPRQAGLFGAAWAVGYAAAIAGTGKISTLALNHLCGPSGVTAPSGAVYPVYHVMRWLCRAGGADLTAMTVDAPGVRGLACSQDGGWTFLLANCGPAPIAVHLSQAVRGRILDSDSFEAAGDPDWADAEGGALGPVLELGPYAVVFGRL